MRPQQNMILPMVTSFNDIFNRETKRNSWSSSRRIALVEVALFELCEDREGSEGLLACAITLVKLVIFKLCGMESWCSVKKFMGFYNNTGKNESTLLMFRSSMKTFPL